MEHALLSEIASVACSSPRSCFHCSQGLSALYMSAEFRSIASSSSRRPYIVSKFDFNLCSGASLYMSNIIINLGQLCLCIQNKR